MLYIKVVRDEAGKPVSAAPIGSLNPNYQDRSIESRWDWHKKGFEEVKAIAALLGNRYIATDAGPNVAPRYDVQHLPQVGDVVSYTFNGDYYPAGTITSISKTKKKITTSEGRDFYRRRESGSWVNNGTWSLIPGNHNRRNPEF